MIVLLTRRHVPISSPISHVLLTTIPTRAHIPRVYGREFDEGEGDYECVTVLSDHTADVKTVRWLPHKDVLVSAR